MLCAALEILVKFGVAQVSDAVALEENHLAGIFTGDVVVENQNEVARREKRAKHPFQHIVERLPVEVVALASPFRKRLLDFLLRLGKFRRHCDDALAALGADCAARCRGKNRLETVGVSRGVARKGNEAVPLRCGELPRLALGFGGNPAAVELVVRPYGIVAAAILRREKIVARKESAAPQLENHARGDAVLDFARQRVERRRSRKRRGLRGFAIGGRLAGFALLYHA